MKFPDVGGGKNGNGGGKTFVKLKSGERVRGVFRGDPTIFRTHWLDRKSEVCPGKNQCVHCGNGDKPKFRFRINFLVNEDGVWIAKIFEQGYGVYLYMKGLHESDYDLEETCVSVSRSGEGTDTRYAILPVKDNGGLKKSDFAALAKVPLNELSVKEVAEDEGDASFEPSEYEGAAV